MLTLIAQHCHNTLRWRATAECARHSVRNLSGNTVECVLRFQIKRCFQTHTVTWVSLSLQKCCKRPKCGPEECTFVLFFSVRLLDRAAVFFARERAIITLSLSAVSARSYQKKKKLFLSVPEGAMTAPIPLVPPLCPISGINMQKTT